ncbi:MAG TPA: regulatory protein RecX [Bacillota bacterium]|nr:regulatory protein RecX [Bacillota bacterium]HOL09460.1 regulatory protein RecX [Bacillota bacterium]HPO97682.1 regulatory protein RecX [Bacillota bacterium]
MSQKQRPGIMDVALKLLSKQSYSQSKLYERLRRNGFDSETIEDCIIRLVEWGYLNDREYTSRKIELLIAKLKSRCYIKNYLINEGLEENLIDSLLDEAYPESLEIQIAERLLTKHRNSSKKRTVDYRILVRGGFSENTISKCFPELDTT